MGKKFYLLFFILFLTTEIYPQWVQTNGPYGGWINALAVKGTNLFAGTGHPFGDNGNVFISTNNGRSWTIVSSGLPGNPVEEIAVSKDGDLFAGTLFGGVYRSTNNGTNWTEVNSGLPDNKWITSFANNGKNIFTSLYYGGVFHSTDNGTSWTQSGLSDKHVLALALTPDGKNLFAGTEAYGIFHSTDNGLTWVEVNLGFTLAYSTVYDFAIIPDVSGELKLLAGTSSGIFHSTDFGTNWNPADTKLNVSSFAVSGMELFACNNAGVFLSTDYGKNWSSLGLSNKDVRTLAVISNSTGGINLFAGAAGRGGIFLYNNSDTSWTEVNNGLIGIDVKSLVVSTDEEGSTNLFAGTFNGIFNSTDNGANWIEINNLSSAALAIFPDGTGGANFYAGAGNKIFLSTNNGIDWTEIDAGIPEYTHISSFAIIDTNLFAGTDYGVFRSTNNGKNWIAVNTGLPKDSYGLNNISTLAVKGVNLFAGTDNANGIFLSTNCGASWAEINSGLPNANIFSLLVSGINIFAGTGDGIFLSTNNGTSWTEVNSGLPSNIAILALTISGINIFMAIETYTDTNRIAGIYLSTDNGTDWQEVNSGLPKVGVRSLAVSDMNLFAGTEGLGIWRRPLSEMITDVKNTTEVPKEFILYQNYPNPFNPTTTIKYSIPQQTVGNENFRSLQLIIYDVLGREVATLINEEKPAGTYEVTWNAANLPSGVYFYQLKAGNYTATKKLLLLK